MPPFSDERMPVSPPRRHPVSRALDLSGIGGPLRRAVLRAGRAVDAVHDDGTLPRVLVDASPGGSKAGVYVSTRGVPERIGILRSGPHPTYSAVHEIAHLLSEQAIGVRGHSDEAHAPELADFRAAVAASKRFAALQAAADPRKPDRKLWWSELFARSYAQYIALCSRDSVLLDDLAYLRSTPVYQWKVWDDADFAPIASALDSLFASLGWR